MKIYIASSWKNQHGVEMLTALLRERKHEVISWVENNYGEDHNHVTQKLPFEKWVYTDQADQAFDFDTTGATTADLVIYYGPAGKDACAELGAAWKAGAMIIGLAAKGEDLGLMRKMVSIWHGRYTDLLENVAAIQRQKDLIDTANDLQGHELYQFANVYFQEIFKEKPELDRILVPSAEQLWLDIQGRCGLVFPLDKLQEVLNAYSDGEEGGYVVKRDDFVFIAAGSEVGHEA